VKAAGHQASHATDHAGPFTTVCKAVQPSPRGTFLAVLSDNGVVVLQKRQGYRYSRLARGGTRRVALRLKGHQELDTRRNNGFSQGLGESSCAILVRVRSVCSFLTRMPLATAVKGRIGGRL